MGNVCTSFQGAKVSATTQIYVRLIGESVDVWRPVEAEPLEDRVFRIAIQEYDENTEVWEFPPGARVLCETIHSSDGPIRGAVSAA